MALTLRSTSRSYSFFLISADLSRLLMYFGFLSTSFFLSASAVLFSSILSYTWEEIHYQHRRSFRTTSAKRMNKKSYIFVKYERTKKFNKGVLYTQFFTLRSLATVMRIAQTTGLHLSLHKQLWALPSSFDYEKSYNN